MAKKENLQEEQARRLAEMVSTEEDKTEFIHQWAYSFLPGSVPSKISITNMEEALFLVGFCKMCRKAVSVKIGIDTMEGFAVLTQTDLPKWGCIAPSVINQ